MSTALITALIGNTVTVQVTFTNKSKQAADPNAVVFKFKSSITKTLTTLTYGVDSGLVRLSTGVYTADIVPNEPGTWNVRAEGTGTVNAAAEGVFDVQAGEFLGTT